MTTEQGLNNLLARLRAKPFAAEREELGRMMFRHIDTYSKEELARYNELKEILRNADHKSS